MADIPSRGLSLKAFDDLNLVRLNNELKRIWTALEALNTAQPASAEVSTEPESDQGYQYYETPQVVTPNPEDPVPDDPPELQDNPMSMQGFDPTVTPHTDGKWVTISWDSWSGVDNDKIKGYAIHWSTSSPCPITDDTLQRVVHGNRTSIDIKAGKSSLERGVTYDFRIVPFSKDARGKKVYGVPSD